MNERAKGVSILRIRDFIVIKLPAYRITVIANFKKNIPLVKPVKFHRSMRRVVERQKMEKEKKGKKESIKFSINYKHNIMI